MANEDKTPWIVRYRWIYSSGYGQWHYKALVGWRDQEDLQGLMEDIKTTEGARNSPCWSGFEYHRVPDHQTQELAVTIQKELSLDDQILLGLRKAPVPPRIIGWLVGARVSSGCVATLYAHGAEQPRQDRPGIFQDSAGRVVSVPAPQALDVALPEGAAQPVLLGEMLPPNWTRVE